MRYPRPKFAVLLRLASGSRAANHQLRYRPGSNTQTATHALPSGRKVACEPISGRVSLTTGDALVDEDFNVNPTVLGPSGLSLVRCRWSVFAHRARCNDVPNRHFTLLDQVSDHRFSAVLTQFRVDRSVAGRVGIACHLNDVSLQASGGLSPAFLSAS